MTTPSIPEIPLKRCTKCDNEYPATTEYFRKNGRWLRGECRECGREDVRHYKLEHPGKVHEYSARERKKHAEARRLYTRNYRIDHPEETREAVRHWLVEHPVEVRVYSQRRRARKRDAIGTHTIGDIRLQLKAQTDKRGRLHCWWCEKVITDSAYHIDHRISLDKGGSNAPENLCISCPTCNLSKGAKLPQEWNGRLL